MRVFKFFYPNHVLHVQFKVHQNIYFISFALQGFVQVESSALFTQDGLRITQFLSVCTYPDPQGWIKNKQEQLLLSRDVVFVILLSEGKSMSSNCLFKVPPANPAVWHVPSYFLSLALFLHRFFFSPPAGSQAIAQFTHKRINSVLWPHPSKSPSSKAHFKCLFTGSLSWTPIGCEQFSVAGVGVGVSEWCSQMMLLWSLLFMGPSQEQ